jgi:hypothetical protein
VKISPTTSELLRSIEQHARKPLLRRDELGMLIELAFQHGGERTLEDASFYAKFCHKTYGIMQRIGAGAEGYEKLATEFAANVQTCKDLLANILRHASDDIRQHFAVHFFAVTPEAFANLLHLFADLTWYKNRLLDERQQHTRRQGGA